LTIYQLQGGRYGPATLLEMKGHTTLSAVPCVRIDWARVVARLE
jgi:hypothetical protein